jgi:diaminopimelate epimerase
MHLRPKNVQGRGNQFCQMSIRFYKYHSLGNDFVLVDETGQPDTLDWTFRAVYLCDRHRGIGADGVLVLRTDYENHKVSMRIFNADGSEAEICLNGIRCCAHYLFEKGTASPIVIECGQRQIINLLHPDQQITTLLPAPAYCESIDLDIGHMTIAGHCVNAGNPHFIIFQQIDLEKLSILGAAISRHPVFPCQTNVEFVWPTMSHNDKKAYHLRVYERGCGATQACSSGAAAVAALLFHQGQIQQNQLIKLCMLGGVLEASVSNGQVTLKSDAHRVFEGAVCNSFWNSAK